MAFKAIEAAWTGDSAMGAPSESCGSSSLCLSSESSPEALDVRSSLHMSKATTLITEATGL